jgi:hypothetical protein
MSNENDELRNKIMKKFNFCTPAPKENFSKVEEKKVKHCHPNVRVDSVEALMILEDQKRKEKAERIKRKLKKKSNTTNKNSLDLLKEVVSKKKENFDGLQKLRKKLNSNCVNEDVIAHFFGLGEK